MQVQGLALKPKSNRRRARVRDEPRAHDLADQRRQVGRDRVHLAQQVRVQLQALALKPQSNRRRTSVRDEPRAHNLAD